MTRFLIGAAVATGAVYLAYRRWQAATIRQAELDLATRRAEVWVPIRGNVRLHEVAVVNWPLRPEWTWN